MGEWERSSEKGRIEQCAQSFSRLAEAFQCLPSKKEELSQGDLQEIFDTVKNDVCQSCGKKADCWGRDVQRTSRLTYELLWAVAEGGGENSSQEYRAREQFFRHCIKGRSFQEELKNSFFRAKLDLMWCNRMLENRAAVAQQYRETARIIGEIACTAFDGEVPDGPLERKVRCRLALQGVWVRRLRVLKEDWGHPRIILTASTVRGHCIAVKRIAQIISWAAQKSFVPERDSRLTLGAEACTLHFVEETGFYMLTGTAKQTCSGESMSGDNFAVLTGNHGQVILGISDGMGSGMRANQESETVIELLEQFLGAGFSAESTVKMINSAMVLQRGMERFSTLDICGIDLYSGRCEFLKIGAATTFIRRDSWVETVTSTSLPIGIFQEVDYEQTRKKLEHGDVIVMVSDGVLDCLPQEEREEIMKYLILENTAENPARFARILLEEALAFSDQQARDDMTILAGGFWKK